jgi:hypothetical protein
MVKKGLTTKPCHGCQQEGLRPIDRVCDQCQRLLEEALAAREQQAKEDGHQVYRVPVRFPWYATGAGYVTQASRAVLDTLRQTFSALVHSVGLPTLGGSFAWGTTPKLFSVSEYRVEYSSYDNHLFLKVPTAEAIDHLDQAIDVAIRAAYQAGKEDGANLLGQLADGSITVGMFNERVMRGKE